jgi:hypothetical protein
MIFLTRVPPKKGFVHPLLALILTALNFGEIGAIKSAKNSDFFRVRKNNYAQLAQDFMFDRPPPLLRRNPC